MSALTTGQFATAHEKLGRNRPTSGLREDHLVRQFFQEVAGERGTVESWTAFGVCVECSICCVVVGFGVSMYFFVEAFVMIPCRRVAYITRGDSHMHVLAHTNLQE